MPNCEPAMVQAMAQHVKAAMANSDWETLRRLDARVRDWLQSMSLAECNEAQLAAWRHLTEVHAQACLRCQEALQDLGQKLETLAMQQEAMKAYAVQDVFG